MYSQNIVVLALQSSTTLKVKP
jgi:hypothetical protein